MRSLIISLVTLLLIVGTYLVFITYSHGELNTMRNQIHGEIEQSVLEENWPAAQTGFQTLENSWDSHSHVFSFFLDTSAMIETDLSLARAKAYITAEERAAALAELYEIREKMKFLYENEQISIDNIF